MLECFIMFIKRNSTYFILYKTHDHHTHIPWIYSGTPKIPNNIWSHH